MFQGFDEYLNSVRNAILTFNRYIVNEVSIGDCSFCYVFFFLLSVFSIALLFLRLFEIAVQLFRLIRAETCYKKSIKLRRINRLIFFTGFLDAVRAVFPDTHIQHCIVHMVVKLNKICFVQRPQGRMQRLKRSVLSYYRRCRS